jgi:anti-anti-sigma regulatory factor
MLRITRHDTPGQHLALRLEGRLVAQWAELLERECATLLESSDALVVDLCGVVVLDRTGVAALGRLHHAGVAIRGCSDILAGILESEGIPVQRIGEGP